MNARRILSFALIVCLAAGSAAPVRAQDISPTIPDSTYAPPDADAYRSPTDLSNPLPDVGPAPHSVTIPIPGGGQVSVEGPDAPPDESIPTNPGGQWGVQGQAPTSQGSGPVGP